MNLRYHENIIDELVFSQRSKKHKTGNNYILLESQDSTHPAGRKSYFAADPGYEFCSYNTNIEIRTPENLIRKSGNPWDLFSEYRAEQAGWWFGYLGYDLKNHTEALISQNKDHVAAPDIYMMQPQLLIEIDHALNRVTVLAGSGDQETGNINCSHSGWSISGLQQSVNRRHYEAMIRESQDRIREGEFYEINLSHQLRSEFEGDGYELYRDMRAAGPVPFGAFLQIDNMQICSLSPERFLQKNGSLLCSQPIKGTAARDHNRREDALRQEELKNEKNLAENLMIVDLVRHDLSRVSVEGSVEVTKLFEIQSFRTVHQLISTVQSRLHEDADPVSVIRACFPMGSMTGAPKISVMKAIEELENYKRGIYSGAIGYFTPENDFDFNVVIRTAIITNNQLHYSVGGAITSDSEPAEEWEETLLKAKALTTILNSEQHSRNRF